MQGYKIIVSYVVALKALMLVVTVAALTVQL